jgi:hypothetical protein
MNIVHDKEVYVTLIGLVLVIGNPRPTHPRETWGIGGE